MSEPIFSVVLPTKNRSEILPMAIESVLNQSFHNWELVIVDNDDADAAQDVVSNYDDPRIRYERTGGLPMWGNWEYAISCAKGRYILIQEDKVAFKPGSLEYLEGIIKKEQPAFCSWGLQAEPGLKDQRWKGINIAAGYEEISPQGLLESFVLRMDKATFWRKAPRGLNCAVKKDICDQIRSSSGAVCPKYSPDFTMAYQILIHSKKCFFLNAILSCLTTTATKYSNGYSVRSGKNEFVRKYFGIDDFDSLIAGMPLKISLPLNSVLADFWKLNARLQWGYSMSSMSMNDYCVAMWTDIMRSKYEFNADVGAHEDEWRCGCNTIIKSEKQMSAIIQSAAAVKRTFFEKKQAHDYHHKIKARDQNVLRGIRCLENIYGKMKRHVTQRHGRSSV